MEDDSGAAGSEDEYEPSSDVDSESACSIDNCDDAVGSQERKAKCDDMNEGKVKGRNAKAHPKNSAKPGTSDPAVSAPAVAPNPTEKTEIAEFAEITKDNERI
jgi:hypothetical protein